VDGAVFRSRAGEARAAWPPQARRAGGGFAGASSGGRCAGRGRRPRPEPRAPES